MIAIREFSTVFFSEQLQILKKEKNVRARDIAEGTGIDYQLVSSYLQGRRNPSAANLFKLARYFGVSCEKFMDCEGIPGAKGQGCCLRETEDQTGNVDAERHQDPARHQ